MSRKTGRCLCGAVTYEYEGPENWCAHCHCESCRRNTASPFTTFVGVPNSAYCFTGVTPKTYASSPGVRRHFCDRCGTPVAYEADRFPDEIHFYAAGLDAPSLIEPQGHVHCAEMLPWVKLADRLPRYAQSSSGDAQPTQDE